MIHELSQKEQYFKKVFRFIKIIFCTLILNNGIKSLISALNRHNKYVNLNAEKNQCRIPYLKILPTSGIIGNTQHLKFVLQAEPEIVYTTTESDILLRDTDVPPNNPLLSLDGDSAK